MRYHAVIFDLAGTLTERFPLNHYRATLARVAHQLSVATEVLHTAWTACYHEQELGGFSHPSATIQAVCERLNVSVGAEQVAAATHVLMHGIAQCYLPRPDALHTLAMVKARGLTTGLISNCPPEVPTLWTQLPFAPYLDSVLFSCCVGMCKPATDIYRLAAQHLAMPEEHCLYIGDGGSHELAGAVRAGMSAVLLAVAGEEDDPYHLSPEAADWRGPRIRSLREVLHHL